MADNINIKEYGTFAIEALNATLTKFSTEASRQTDTIIFLTKWLVGLTLVMTVAVLVQIVMMGKDLEWF